MIPIFILILSLLLDGLLTIFLPYMQNDLSLFTPLFTMISIFIIFPFYRKKEKKYFITIFILGIIYDLFYTNLLFFNSVLFIIIGIVTLYIYKNFEITPFKLILYTIIIVAIYESTTGLILFLYNIVPVTIEKIIYKIIHSLILNIIYIEIIHYIVNRIPKKYKKISIN